MPTIRTAAFVAAILAIGAPPAAAAQPPSRLLAKHGPWLSFAAQDQPKPVCYVAGEPAKSEGAYTKRDKVYLMVTHRPGERALGVVSFVAGYPLKPDSEVTVSIGKDVFKLYTAGETAWARDADEKKLVAALKAGKEAVVKGQSARGTATTDEFSLVGFSQALQDIDKACPARK